MIHMKHFLCITLCMSIQQVFCMEQSDTKEVMGVLSEIKTWKDVERFTGFIVAYTGSSKELGKERGYSLYQDSSLNYGYVEEEPLVGTYHNKLYEEAYTLWTLINKIDCGYCNLTDSSIAKANLLMRVATLKEINQIRIAISDNNAGFGKLLEDDLELESNGILQRCKQLKYLPELKKKYAEDLAKALLKCYQEHDEKRIPVAYPILPYEMLLHITKFKYGVEN